MSKHEKPASAIDDLTELKRHMCTAAIKRTSIVPEICEKCEMPCAYGVKALKMLGRKAPAYNHDFRMTAENVELLNLDQRIRGVRKERSLNLFFGA